ncbi:hypothetical protein [Archangium sp.]|uniref:hypothetical protein n=1 Tax=Archangium sp. TaxID=1872627 RepID=UPI00389AF5F4
MDWISGGNRHGLDGSVVEPPVRYGYRFDSAVMSRDGRYAVIYERLGTKGLVVKEGMVEREINRSCYHADAYEYPVALVTLPSGRTLLAHCPDEYCRLELEDVETGERLTRRKSESPDIFHSRLQFSRDGRYLLSAGWLWHPVDVAYVFDVARALEHPESLDQPQGLAPGDSFVEVQSAAFGEKDTLVARFWGLEGSETEEEGGLGVYSLTERRFLSVVQPGCPMGTMMVMDGYVVGFYEHPRLIELATGRVVEQWPELSTGKQASSIIRHLPRLPPFALDPARCRFAVGTEKGIEVVSFR